MKIGALELQRSQYTFKSFLAPPGIAGQLPALTASVGRVAIRVIGIEVLLDGAAGQKQRLPPDSRFQGFQIEVLQALASQQCFDVP